jgi:hypothetical protein
MQPRSNRDQERQKYYTLLQLAQGGHPLPAPQCITVRYNPSTGQNLLMAGADLLDAPTGTAVAQRSEAGQEILGAKKGKCMWVWLVRDNVPCLAITAI